MRGKLADSEGAPWKGASLALASATFFALNTPLAAVAYSDTVTPITLVVFRSLVAGLLALGVLLVQKQSGFTRLLTRPAFWLTTIGIAFQGMCYLASVAYIPVGLAAMILYIWPLLVAVCEPFFGGPKLTVSKLLCFLAAFLGLSLAIGPDFDSLNPLGIGLVMLAAFSLPLYVIGSRRLLADTPVSHIIAGTNLGAAGIAFAAAPLLGGLSFGSTIEGVTGSAAVIAFFVAGILTQTLALRVFRPSALAILFNLEPLISIAAGAILLAETLTLPQYAGGAVVLTALAFYSWFSRSPTDHKSQ